MTKRVTARDARKALSFANRYAPMGQPNPPVGRKLRKVLKEREAMTNAERFASTAGFDTIDPDKLQQTLRQFPEPAYGRGWRRMQERLGPERAEALRQDVLKDQIAARKKYGGQEVLSRDRTSYKGYPKSNRSKRRKT